MIMLYEKMINNDFIVNMRLVYIFGKCTDADKMVYVKAPKRRNVTLMSDLIY